MAMAPASDGGATDTPSTRSRVSRRALARVLALVVAPSVCTAAAAHGRRDPRPPRTPAVSSYEGAPATARPVPGTPPQQHPSPARRRRSTRTSRRTAAPACSRPRPAAAPPGPARRRTVGHQPADRPARRVAPATATATARTGSGTPAQTDARHRARSGAGHPREDQVNVGSSPSVVVVSMTANGAPWGSITAAWRPKGIVIGPNTSLPPSFWTVATAASQSATVQ